jgi:transcriptional regulator with XRE-family HTH domain
MPTISGRMRKALALRGMKQVDIVEKTGISKGSISSYVAGRYEPKPNSLRRIAKVLGVSEPWLAGMVDDDGVPYGAEEDDSRAEILDRERIKKLRKDRGMTLADVAERLGVSRQTISRYETGRIKDVSIDSIAALAKVFHVPPAELTGWQHGGPDEVKTPKEEVLYMHRRNIGERIKEIRLEQSLTLLEVAEYIGVTEATVQRYESGNIKSVKADTLVKLCKLFNVGPSYLQGYSDERGFYAEDYVCGSVGERLKALRLRAGMTQDQLGNRIGENKQNIHKYEKGVVANIPHNKLIQLAAIFHVSPNDLLGVTDSVASKPAFEQFINTFGVSTRFHNDEEQGETYVRIDFGDGTLDLPADEITQIEKDVTGFAKYKFADARMKYGDAFRPHKK